MQMNQSQKFYSLRNCNGIDFGSLRDQRRYTQCRAADAIDREQKNLKTRDKNDSLKKLKINW